MHPESKPDVYPTLGKNQKLRPLSAERNICMQLLQLASRPYQVWSTTQTRDWPGYACPSVFFSLQSWNTDLLKYSSLSSSDLASRVCRSLPGSTSLCWGALLAPHCGTGVARVPLPQSCSHSQSCCLRLAPVPAQQPLFSASCTPNLVHCRIVAHSPCVLSQGARAGNLQTASLPTLETQTPGAVHWATFPVSPRPVTRCSFQLQKHQWSESARTEMLPFLHNAWGEAVLKHPWSAITFLWEASSEEVSVVWYRERRMSSHHAACRVQQKPRLSVLAFPLQRCRHSDPQPLRKANKSREGRAIVRSRWSPNAAHHHCVWCLDFLSSTQDN